MIVGVRTKAGLVVYHKSQFIDPSPLLIDMCLTAQMVLV